MKISSKEEMEAPKDWEWSEEWEVEDAGVEDKDGWQYAVEKEGKLWSSNMRTTHLYRKRTLVRKMVKQRDDKVNIAWSTSCRCRGIQCVVRYKYPHCSESFLVILVCESYRTCLV